MNKILFDATSTSPISELIAIAPGDCILLNAWGLGPGELAQVYRVSVALGNIPEQQSGSCAPPPAVIGAAIQTETPFFPCNVPVQVGEDGTQNITSLVIQQPGFYRVHLTPAALGTAVVEAVVLTGEEACAAAARQCCCTPETFWIGVSTNPCLVITPGGVAGHEPVFSLDACCLLHAFPALPAPQLTDELVVLSGGSCFRSTIAQVFDPAVICTTLGTYLLQAPAVGDTIVVIDAGLNCFRRDAETLVEFFETPWTGISITPALVIAPGGINGHGPTFSYDLCADLQAIAPCVCEPAPGDLVPIIQGGACTLAQWPEVDACTQFGLLPTGAILAGDQVVARDTNGDCKLIDAVDFLVTPFPLLAPDGNCASPSYSFTSSPDSGMFYDPAGLGSVVIGDDNCADFIAIGASINIVSTLSDVNTTAGGNIVENATGSISSIAGTALVLLAGASILATAVGGGISLDAQSGNVNAQASASFTVTTAATPRLAIDNSGAWQLAGNAGLATQVLTSSGPGLPPLWQPAGGVTFPLFAPITPTPQYSFVGFPDTGMALSASQLFVGQFDGATPASSSGLRVDTGALGQNVFLEGRDVAGAPFVSGGVVTVRGGNGGSEPGGRVDIFGGDTTTHPSAGAITIRTGSSAFAFGNSGELLLATGNNAAGTQVGDIVVRPGSAGPSYASGGNVLFSLGLAVPEPVGTKPIFNVELGNFTQLRLEHEAGNISFLNGQQGRVGSPTGQQLRVSGGPGQPIGPGGAGGLLRLAGGAATAGGVNPGGNLTLEGGLGAGGGVIGHVYIPKVAIPPTEIPTNLGAPYAPIQVEEGVATTCIWIYNFPVAAWHPFCANGSGVIAGSVGATAFPLLAPDGSCAAPSYSFTNSPDSGMFYTGSAVRIGDDNCTDFIEVGASINLVSAGTVTTVAGANIVDAAVGAITVSAGTTVDITAAAGNATISASNNFIVVTNATTRLAIGSVGAWSIGGVVGTAGQVITSNGLGVPPTWQTSTIGSGGMVWGCQSVGSAAETRVIPVGYDDALISTQTPKGYVTPRAGTFRNLFVRTNTANGNGNSVDYTLRVNGVATLLSVTRATGAIGTSSNLVNTVAVAQGDLIEMLAIKALSIGSGVQEVFVTAEFGA